MTSDSQGVVLPFGRSRWAFPLCVSRRKHFSYRALLTEHRAHDRLSIISRGVYFGLPLGLRGASDCVW